MTDIALELDRRLQELDPKSAEKLERLVRDALALLEPESNSPSPIKKGWPPGYFEATAGALEGEEFERPPQGELQERDAW